MRFSSLEFLLIPVLSQYVMCRCFTHLNLKCEQRSQVLDGLGILTWNLTFEQHPNKRTSKMNFLKVLTLTLTFLPLFGCQMAEKKVENSGEKVTYQQDLHNAANSVRSATRTLTTAWLVTSSEQNDQMVEAASAVLTVSSSIIQSSKEIDIDQETIKRLSFSLINSTNMSTFKRAIVGEIFSNSLDAIESQMEKRFRELQEDERIETIERLIVAAAEGARDASKNFLLIAEFDED